MPSEIVVNILNNQEKSTSSFHLRGNDINEIISNKPSFLIRWGITIFFVILLLVIAACWFIQYPDIVTTNAKLTCLNAPKEIRTKTDGRLVQLFVEEGKQVNEKDIVGFIESRANHYSIIQLSAFMDSLSIILEHHPEQLNNFITPLKNVEVLGEIQPQYQVFTQGYMLFKQYLAKGFYAKKRLMLQQDLAYLTKLNSNLLLQMQMQKEDLELQQQTFEANEKLQKEKVISALDYRNEKSKLISKKLGIPQLNAALINNETNKHDKQKEIAELENLIGQQKTVFQEALNNFRAVLDEWKTKYVLIAPVAGKVSFATFLQQNQQLSNNQTICFINPTNSKIYAETHIPQSNFGKVQKSQKVLLKFLSYPYQQYGSIEGNLDFISNIPSDSGYIAKIIFPTGLITNYNKKLQFRQGLTAQSEIITQDLRLLERFFYQAKSIFKSSSN